MVAIELSEKLNFVATERSEIPKLTANIPLLSAQGKGHHRIMMTRIVPFAFYIPNSNQRPSCRSF